MWSRALRALVALLCLAGCAPEPVELTAAPWRALVELPGGELPFVVRFDRDAGGALAATIENGAERVRVGTVDASPDALTLAFPALNSRLALRRDGRRYAGELVLVKEKGEQEVMPVTLTPHQEHRFFADAQDVNADFGGRWATTFTEPDGSIVEAVGEFTQRNGRVTGTFRTPTGDYRFLAGGVRDRTLYLSTFDGAHAFLFVATQKPDGRVRGDFWSGAQWHASFVAVRSASAALPDAAAMSRVRDDVQTPNFSFPDTSDQIVSLDDAHFKDKSVVITLAGSWCPNWQTVFDRTASVRHVPAGFNGTGTGVHYDDFRASLDALIKNFWMRM